MEASCLVAAPIPGPVESSFQSRREGSKGQRETKEALERSTPLAYANRNQDLKADSTAVVSTNSHNSHRDHLRGYCFLKGIGTVLLLLGS